MDSLYWVQVARSKIAIALFLVDLNMLDEAMFQYSEAILKYDAEMNNGVRK